MCKEIKAILKRIETMDNEEARAEMERLSKEHPFIFSEQKGASIARRVLELAASGQIPLPPLLGLNESPRFQSARHLTKGFLNYCGTTLEQIQAPGIVLDQVGAISNVEMVRSVHELTPREATFSELDYSLPAIRLTIEPVTTGVVTA